MAQLEELQHEVSAALVAAQADGQRLGYDRAVADFYGQNAAFLLANIFADAMDAAAGRLASHDHAFSRKMMAFATMLRESVLQPSVTAVVPADGGKGDPTSITVKFSEDMDAASVVASAFVVGYGDPLVAVDVVVSYDVQSRTATLTPQSVIAVGDPVTVTVGAVKNTQGVAADAVFTWSFTAAAPTARKRA